MRSSLVNDEDFGAARGEERGERGEEREESEGREEKSEEKREEREEKRVESGREELGEEELGDADLALSPHPAFSPDREPTPRVQPSSGARAPRSALNLSRAPR